MTPTTYSRTLSRTITELRPMFSGFAEKLFTSKADLAPAFLKAYGMWQRETDRGLVAFVRELDHSLPVDRDRYMHHRSFQAAWYLVRSARLAKQSPSGKVGRHTVTPLRLLAMVLRTVLDVQPNDKRIWDLIASTTHWHSRDMTRLKKAVGQAKQLPLFPDQPRLVRARLAAVTAPSRDRDVRLAASH